MPLTVAFEGVILIGAAVPGRSIAITLTTPVVAVAIFAAATLIVVPNHFGRMASLYVCTNGVWVR